MKIFNEENPVCANIKSIALNIIRNPLRIGPYTYKKRRKEGRGVYAETTED